MGGVSVVSGWVWVGGVLGWFGWMEWLGWGRTGRGRLGFVWIVGFVWIGGLAAWVGLSGWQGGMLVGSRPCRLSKASWREADFGAGN